MEIESTVVVVNSSSKYHQNEDILRKMTERALNEPVFNFSFKELGGGMSNAVYRVEADDRVMVLKIASNPSVVLMRHEKDCIINEANILKICEEKIDIPSPKLIYLDTSYQICNVPYFFMSYMEGMPLMNMLEKPSKEAISEIKWQVGLICRKISSIQAPCFGIPMMPDTYRENNCDFVLTLFDMLLKDATDQLIEVPSISHTELLSLIEAQRNVLNEAQIPYYIHTDTWDGNLMVKDNKLVGLIDYAAVLYGDPLMNHDFHDFGELNTNFCLGYGKSEFSKNDLIRISIYKIWQRLGMIVERGFRNYEDNNLYAWVMNEFSKEIENLKQLI